MGNFTHLHVHTQYSLLDGASKISDLVSKVKEQGMTAVAITDHGNMFGVKQFFETAKKQGIKPIIGCEVYVARRGRTQQDGVEDRSGDHLILLAKNKNGYHNLVKLVSQSWIDGFYYKPRIDKDILRQYKDDLIVSSACLGGEVPQAIMHRGGVDEVIQEYKEMFGDDYYLEVMDHGLPEQKDVNQKIFELAQKHNVKVIATNDSHFVNATDAEAHDILVCLSTGRDYEDPNRMRYTGNEYLKSREEMFELFPNNSEALDNTMEIADKIEEFDLNRDILLPEFPLPEGFDNQDDYLRHLTYEGAKTRYEEINDEVTERLDYELKVIKDMGFAGYFLIVQDFIAAAREIGVAVGPGRGSAAGSAVAFCTGITNIDPIKYRLLFERFLNPERVTMPDVDIDFDDEGRDKVLNWVVEKYGQSHVGQIITFGSMAAKSSIKDVARVLKLPLSEANRLAKFVPDGAKMTLAKAFKEVPELNAEKSSNDPLIAKTLRLAENLEGSVRQTGIHACGIIIGPEDLQNHIPLSTNKETELLVTQFDGKHVEDVGMLKMDFLGLKTLTIIKDAIANVKQSRGIEIDPDEIPLDDPKAFELYQNGETVGTFQFESPGMRKYLKELKPSNLEDLFAMNALYRPGPMDYIPSFIARKQGKEKVEYPHEMLEDLLKDTYGIMIYQEQIMRAAQIMGGFSLGSADILRRAMGKKKMDIMAQQKEIFIDGAEKKGVPREKSADVFGVMEKFAAYGFNRSHSAAYSIVAFQTGYLKANYPAEYMASVLSHNLNDIKKITIFMDECKRMGMPVLGPDVNESNLKFTVNKDGAVRFGLAAIKGVGENASLDIIKEREENGNFNDIFDFVERVNLRSVNKRNIESLSLAGAFDSFTEIKRHQFFAENEKEQVFIDTLVKYGANMQSRSSSAPSLFGAESGTEIETPKPTIPQCEEWSKLQKLNKEKELIGIYLSAHPLDDYKLEIKHACNITLSDFEDLSKHQNKELKVAGIITTVEERTTKTGNPFGSMTLEDYTDSYRFMFFSKDYLKLKQYFTEGYSILMKGKVMPRYNNPNEFEFKANTIEMLSDLQGKAFNKISLKLSIDNLDENIIAEIQQKVEDNKGNATLNFLIFEPASKIWVQMFSRTHKVNVSPELIQFLEDNSIAYKVE